jgi:hypothetical protein
MKHMLPLTLLCAIFTGATAVAQDTAEVALAKATLDALQGRSFAESREFCGYLILDASGNLTATNAIKGAESYCEPGASDDDVVIIASYHTHGAFEYDTPAEFPSVDDIEADEAEGIDGYMTSPGGRFWYIDTTDMVVSQICGVGCVTQDPRFEAGLDGEIAQSYTYEDLLALEGN